MLMKRNYLFGILLLSFVSIVAGGCEDEEIDTLSFYSNSYEVPLHGNRYIGIRRGSGNYSLQVGNPWLFSASEDNGWSNPSGMILVHGLLTGESTLNVTDRKTGETINLKIRVIDNYEVLHVSSFKNEHPVLSKCPFVFLINNKSRDVYFADRKGENSITGNGIRVRGKGSYSLTMEDGKPYLTLIYATDNNGELTNDAAFDPVPHKFQFSQYSEFLLHRLDDNLNLGLETIAGNYSADQASLFIKMQQIGSDDQLESSLEQVEFPKDIL